MAQTSTNKRTKVLALIVVIAAGAAFDSHKKATSINYAAWRGVNLRSSNWAKTYWSGRVLLPTRLKGVDLSGANLSKAGFIQVDFRGAKLVDANLSGATFKGCDFTGADLSDADLRGADLRYSVFRNTNLQNARLEGSTLYAAELYGADLTGANVAGVDFAMSGADQRTRWPENFQPGKHDVMLFDQTPPRGPSGTR